MCEPPGSPQRSFYDDVPIPLTESPSTPTSHSRRAGPCRRIVGDRVGWGGA